MNLEELRQCYLDEEVPSIEDIYECDFTNVLEVFSSKEIKRATETGDESADLFFQVKSYADTGNKKFIHIPFMMASSFLNPDISSFALNYYEWAAFDDIWRKIISRDGFLNKIKKEIKQKITEKNINILEFCVNNNLWQFDLCKNLGLPIVFHILKQPQQFENIISLYYKEKNINKRLKTVTNHLEKNKIDYRFEQIDHILNPQLKFNLANFLSFYVKKYGKSKIENAAIPGIQEALLSGEIDKQEYEKISGLLSTKHKNTMKVV